MCGAPSISTTIRRLKSLAGTTATDPPLEAIYWFDQESCELRIILPGGSAQGQNPEEARRNRRVERCLCFLKTTRLIHAYACVTLVQVEWSDAVEGCKGGVEGCKGGGEGHGA